MDELDCMQINLSQKMHSTLISPTIVLRDWDVTFASHARHKTEKPIGQMLTNRFFLLQ